MSRNRLPSAQPPAPQATAATFLLVPLACLPPQCPAQAAWQIALYQWAFARAQEAARPSLIERDLLAVWN
jgi:hypothetical protein